MSYQLVVCQKMVSITIDDVPNTARFENDGYQSVLLDKLDSLEIPIAIFINEGLIYRTDSISKNFALLNNWTEKGYITLGNHSFDHSRYSTNGIDVFSNQIINGESISRQLAKKYKKPLKHFRFPYNDLGGNSIQHSQIKHFLKEKGYVIAPFTIESSDWMFNTVYKHYVYNKEFKKAKEIGDEYIIKTLEYFDFFEALGLEDYKRTINQVYLCHDNKINADFLPQLVTELRKREYTFISLEDALTDEVYQQKDNYYKKWGVSWMYRWKSTQKERASLMNQEPSIEKIQILYEKILKAINDTK
jgi:peptidoglycan/xylan/chitin deacetylase (PgdA/CDA1 family)